MAFDVSETTGEAIFVGRRFGLQPPYNRFQILAWLLVLSYPLTYFTAYTSLEADVLPGSWYGLVFSDTLYQGVLFCVVLPCYLVLSLYDPRVKQDPEIYDKTSGKQYCSECAIHMAPRMHHCKSCDKCVDKFDHHCNYLNTCISTSNYAPFLLILTALSYLSGIQMMLFAQHTLDYYYYGVNRGSTANARLSAAVAQRVLAGAFLPLLVGFLFLFSLLLFHMYLMLSRQTTLQFYRARRVKKTPQKKLPVNTTTPTAAQSTTDNGAWDFDSDVDTSTPAELQAAEPEAPTAASAVEEDVKQPQQRHPLSPPRRIRRTHSLTTKSAKLMSRRLRHGRQDPSDGVQRSLSLPPVRDHYEAPPMLRKLSTMFGVAPLDHVHHLHDEHKAEIARKKILLSPRRRRKGKKFD